MQSLLLLIPTVVLAGLWSLTRRRHWADSTGGALLRAAVLWGLIDAFIIEALSPLRGLTPSGLSLAWLAVGAVVAVLWFRTSTESRVAGLRMPAMPGAPADRVALGIVFLVLATTAVVAWMAPPQTWDSLNYHLARVGHWAQQASVAHYPTGIEVQNSRPPGAEYIQLLVYVLGGGDRFLPLLNWAEFLLSVVAGGVIAKRIDRRAQLPAMACLATIPMAIIQASSTVNDLAVGLWVLAFTWEVMRIGEGSRPALGWLFMGGAAGLALLTKPTAFTYLLPLSLWAGVRIVRRRATRGLMGGLVVAALLVVGLNLPYLLRNQRTFGSPLDPTQVEIHSNQTHAPAVLVSNTLRNAALNANTPIPVVNKAVFLAVVRIHQWLGISPNNPGTTAHEPFRVHSFSTHEERSGNTVQAMAILVAMVLLVKRRQSLPPGAGALALAALAAFLLISLLFQWQVFGSRYQLPFFMLWAPLLGVLLAPARRWIAIAALVVLFVGCIPWLISIRSRPLVPIPGQVSAPSVLVGERQALYFTNGEYLQQPYSELTNRIKEQGCQTVGLSISGSSAEYLLWELLGAPDPKLRVEWIVANTPSARYQPANFAPCAVICQNCVEGETSFRGLPLAEAIDSYALFLAKGK